MGNNKNYSRVILLVFILAVFCTNYGIAGPPNPPDQNNTSAPIADYILFLALGSTGLVAFVFNTIKRKIKK